MNTEQLIQSFVANHNFAAEFICTLSDEQFMHTNNDKWTAGQQLSHLILCIQPMGKALSSAAYIREKFGTIDRVVMSYDELIAFYKNGLQQGGKAPERVLPPAIELSQREALQQELNEVLTTIQQYLSSYSDADLDSLVLPHPFLGLLSLREFFYLMSYHPLHHLEQVKKNLEVFKG